MILRKSTSTSLDSISFSKPTSDILYVFNDLEALNETSIYMSIIHILILQNIYLFIYLIIFTEKHLLVTQNEKYNLKSTIITCYNGYKLTLNSELS